MAKNNADRVAPSASLVPSEYWNARVSTQY